MILKHTPVRSVLTEDGRVTGLQTITRTVRGGRVTLAAAAFNAKLMKFWGILFPVAGVRLQAMVTTALPLTYYICFIGHGISVRPIHMWTPPVMQRAFGPIERVIGCGDVSGLSLRPFRCRGPEW